MTAEGAKLPAKFARRSTLKPITGNKFQCISGANSQERARPALKSLSGNQLRSKPITRTKTLEALKRDSRRNSQPGRFDVTRPDSSIRHPIIAQASKPSPSVSPPTSAPTSVSIQKGTSDIPETDPKATKLLWWKVERALRKKRNAYHRMPFDRTTRSSAAKKHTGKKRANPPTKRLVFGLPSIDPPSSKTETTKQLAKAHAYDVQFRDMVLHPRGILHNETDYIVLGEPYEYFQTSAPAGLHPVHYMATHPDSTIWLDVSSLDTALIVSEYRLGETQNESEEFFSDCAKWFLLKKDRLEDSRLAETSRRTYQKFKSGPPPDIKYPLPPLMPTTKPAIFRPYEFRINPDMTFYLSLKAVNPQYRFEVFRFTPVVSECAIAAYFTIQFKKDNHTAEQAQNQATAASAMWLYHRVVLRKKRLDAEKVDPSASHFEELKHYTITLRGLFYTIWVTVPSMNADGEWKGCTMRKLCNANFGSEEMVIKFAQWVNEIHNWGLGSWADGIIDDIKIVLRNSLGARGVVSLTTDEIKEF